MELHLDREPAREHAPPPVQHVRRLLRPPRAHQRRDLARRGARQHEQPLAPRLQLRERERRPAARADRLHTRAPLHPQPAHPRARHQRSQVAVAALVQRQQRHRVPVHHQLRTHHRMEPRPLAFQREPDHAAQVRVVRQPQRRVAVLRRPPDQCLRRRRAVPEREGAVRPQLDVAHGKSNMGSPGPEDNPKIQRTQRDG